MQSGRRKVIPDGKSEMQEEMKTCIQMFIAAASIIAKKAKQPKCPATDEYIENFIYPYNGMLFSHKKE